jgi:hypothetical protein
MKLLSNRRDLLMGVGGSWLLRALLPRHVYASYLAGQYGEVYRQIGIRPFINAAGTYTVLTGSIIPDRVREPWRRRPGTSSP